ncbi:hypothetical protein [Streptomyces murinus]|uniref:hypothetical protein n=1 Tax=Streptomyces murinus TaxID=33900 RepID=UPI0018F3516A|nr:hypothetical protein [Streptomyces murinus]
MTFPQTPLPLQVDLCLDGSTWTDITSDVRAEQQIKITRGRSDWGQQVDYSRCQLTLSNADGRYSPRNPSGPYYGQIGRNTPLRVSVNTGSVALDLPGGAGDYASTPDAAALDITGDLDIRIDASLANWILASYPSSGQPTYPRTELIGKFASTQRSYALSIIQGRPYLEWSVSGSTSIAAWCLTGLPLTTSGRLALRATLDVDNGAGGWTATFYTAPSINGSWTQLGNPIVSSSGATSIFSGSSTLKIGDATHLTFSPAMGRVHAAQVYNGINGTLVANPDFTAQTSGATSFTDSTGKVWSLSGNTQITNRKTRFVGEIASWTPQWDTGGFDPIVAVEAAGVMRRLGIGTVPTKSPMYREFTTAGRMGIGIVAYWPMEDGADSTTLASAYGHQPATFTAGVSLASYSGWAASDPIPTLTSGSLRAMMPPYTLDSVSTGSVGFFASVPAAGVLSTQRLMSCTTTGTATTWSVWLNTSGNLAVRAYDGDGTQLFDSGFDTNVINGLDKYVILAMAQSGTNVSWYLEVADITGSMPTAIPGNAPVQFELTGTLTTATTGRITQVQFGQDAGMNGTAIGHLAIGSTTAAFTASVGAIVGWNAEDAASRTARIGAEENLNSYPTSPGDEQCGVQPRDGALNIMRSAGDVDSGILAELRSRLGLRYITRASMYNQPAALTLNYQGDDGLVAPLEPTDDDQGITNDVTVQRTSGSSAHVTLSTGALSTQVPPNGIGLYDTSSTLNLLDDTQPINHAGWLLHVGSWDETRFPVITVNLATAPTSIESAAAVDTGSRVQITNPPAWLPPDTIDLLVQGYAETLAQFTWTLAYNCVPYGPFKVAYESDGRVDTAGSQLAAAMTSTATTASMSTTSGTRWVDSAAFPAEFPFDVVIGGERMQVTAITGTTSPQTFTVTRSINGVVKAQSSGADVRLADPAITAL